MEAGPAGPRDGASIGPQMYHKMKEKGEAVKRARQDPMREVTGDAPDRWDKVSNEIGKKDFSNNLTLSL